MGSTQDPLTPEVDNESLPTQPPPGVDPLERIRHIFFIAVSTLLILFPYAIALLFIFFILALLFIYLILPIFI